MEEQENLVVIVYDGDSDWEGLYVNSELVHQSNYISASDIMVHLDIDFEYIACDVTAGLPERLEDVIIEE